MLQHLRALISNVNHVLPALESIVGASRVDRKHQQAANKH
jgi:hypothetical protein